MLDRKTVISNALMLSLLFVFLFAGGSLVGCARVKSYNPFQQSLESKVESKEKPEVRPGQFVSLDGYDASVGITVLSIALWNDYKNQAAGFAGVGRHGDGVKFIKRVGDGILVEISDGRRGWVDAIFIKEFK
ncbi:MAG: hypothetical protein O6948_14225 [Deltaproteobacteria bacterium]|nr:hypothetical protein [Deltaproteobacteria bacterium]